MSFISNKISQRLGGANFFTNNESNESYKFAKIKRDKSILKNKHPNLKLIDMGIGEPDKPADPIVIKTLCRECGKPENKWYADNGIPEFLEAAGKYLKNIYGLNNITPHKEILHGIGAKSILSLLPLCFINPGDITLSTVPGYPVLSTHTKYLGGEVYSLPLYRDNDFYPDFSKIPKDILKRTKMLYINYPNNPTGQVATKEFFQGVVEFAYKNEIIVVSDASYGTITFDGYEPLSFLSVDGAKEVGVEIHSLSKAFNMTGWRLAFIAGNPEIIKAYGEVKSNSDSGQFIAIQKSGISALNHPEIAKENSKRYSRRLDLLVPALKEIGFEAKKPKGTFYCYVPSPQGTKTGILFSNAEEASSYILENALISTVPWDSAGSYLRFSVTFEADGYEEEKEMIEELKNRLLKLQLIF